MTDDALMDGMVKTVEWSEGDVLSALAFQYSNQYTFQVVARK